MIIDELGYSFPSSHSVVSIVFYGTMLRFLSEKKEKSKIKVLGEIILVALMMSTPMSRIYLGVHNLTDVVIGVILGFFILRTDRFITQKINKKEEVNRLGESK